MRHILTDLFGLGSTTFGVESALPGPGGRGGLAPEFGRQGRLTDQTDQSAQGILTVLLLGPKPPGLDDQDPCTRHPFSGHGSETPADIGG